MSESKSPYVLEFELQGLPKLTNQLSRSKWQPRMKEATKWKDAVIIACYGKAPPKPLTKAKISFIRYSACRPDFDGLVSGFKRILDGLRLANIILDDNYDVIGQPEYSWERAPKSQGKVKIKVTEMEENYGEENNDKKDHQN